jgi:signal transduction histidine kinase/ligand-binding sensor domain-containing protein/DNA-binding response OmpR family regulator
MRLRQTLFFLILQLLSTGLFAQNELYFTHLGMEEGFSNSRANTILQDRKGFIWVGTWNGLNRYDGYECKTFQPNFHDSTAISNREIVELMEDSKGNIWIGTSNGLNCMNPETGSLKTYPFRHRILSLCEDKELNIWIGTWNGGLYKLTPSTGKINHYLANDIVSDIYLDSRNILWVGTYYGLVRFNREDGQYQRFLTSPDQNSISNSTITQITESSDGNLWIGTWGGGLSRVQVRNSGTQLNFSNFYADSGDHSLSNNVISKLFYDRYNNLWIGTWDNGLRLLREDQQQLSPQKAHFLSYNNEKDNPLSISGNGISALMVDRTGVLWIGGATIDRASIIESGINRYKLSPENVAENLKNPIRAITSYQNQLWMGTADYILQYELKNQVYHFKKKYASPSYKMGNSRYESTSILDMAACPTGLWVGTDDAGLVFYPFKSNLLLDEKNQAYYNQQTKVSVPGNKIVSLKISKKYPGVIWVGTMQSGFSKIVIDNKKGNYAEHYQAGDQAENYSDNNIRSIWEDSHGIIWIGTQNGLNRFDPTTKQFQKFFYSPSDNSSINDNVINTIREDQFGNLWIGTNSGLNKKIEQTDETGNTKIFFKGYPDQKVIKNEIVTNILEDNSNNLWIRMYRGFIKFNIPREMILDEYFSKDYENTRFERNTTIKRDNGSIILADPTGFITFYPDSLLKKSVPPKVILTDFQVFNESLNPQTAKRKKNKLKVTIPYADQLKLSYKDKMLTFVFSAMDYKNPGKNEYLYKLEGFDSQWNDVGTRNSATYTNLPHGEYTFKVKTKNSDGVWSENDTELRVTISPPWWKTIWAYFFYAILIAGILYFFNKYTFIKAHEKSNLKFEKLKMQELARLNEMKSFFFTDITHELKTPLTLILGPARELSSDKSLSSYAAKQAELIKNSAYKLLRLVNQLMEFRKIEKGVMEELFVQQCDLGQLLKEVYYFFKPMAESRKINFSVHIRPEPIIAYLDPDKIEKVIFNLLSNAFKYSKDNGIISVSGELQTDEGGKQVVAIEVKDSGIGIADEHQQKIFERFYQVNEIRTQSTGGIGLFMAKALVEQHGGTIELTSKWGKGSCFKLKIPVNPQSVKNENTSIPKEDTASKQEIDNPFAETTETTEFPPGSPKKNKPVILVVEDDRDLNDFLVTGLSSDFRVISAFNGKEALRKAQEQLPDLILTDIMMPEMDGFEFCRLTRKDINISHIPVVFLTAKTMQEDEIKGLKLGAVDYIYKPFNLISLKLKINNILSSRKHIRERLRTEQILQPETMELSALDEDFLKNAAESVNNNLDSPDFDVEAFSKDLGISPNQAYRKIKALTGQTAKEFIRTQRLKIAATLLVQRKRSISEIIYMVGFTSPSYFTRCFKEFYGCTPSEYMERNT